MVVAERVAELVGEQVHPGHAGLGSPASRSLRRLLSSTACKADVLVIGNGVLSARRLLTPRTSQAPARDQPHLPGLVGDASRHRLVPVVRAVGRHVPDRVDADGSAGASCHLLGEVGDLWAGGSVCLSGVASRSTRLGPAICRSQPVKPRRRPPRLAARR